MKKVVWLLFICLGITNLVGQELSLEQLRNPKVGGDVELPIRAQRLVFNQENGRIFYIPLKLSGKTAIKISIVKGSDNSGDKGMSWKLVESINGKVIQSALAKRDKKQTWVVKDIRTLNPVLVLEDTDTRFDGKYPGNGFEIAVSFP